MNRDEVFVLGAGASCAHGAPLSNEILPYALTLAVGNAYDERQRRYLEQVREYLRKVFHVDNAVLGEPIRTRDDLREAAHHFPSLVDALSVVDMALDRKESLTGGYDQGRLRIVRESLEYAIFIALRHALSHGNPFRSETEATRKLAAKCAAPERSAVISLNYDVLIDIALVGGQQNEYRLEDRQVPLNYGLPFANVDPPDPRCPYLLKLHGSFNWLHSSITGNVYYGGLQKRIAMLYQDGLPQDQPEHEYGGERLGDLHPILITPTHLKDLRNVHLGVLWHRAAEVLRGARALTFVGYSLPGDDLHIKYLIKRALETGDAHPKITVVDHNPAGGRSWVQENYETFFGRGHVEFFGDGFEAYAQERL